MPREKALNYGISSLNNSELISLVLKSAYKDSNVFKLADELIDTAGGFNNLLSLTYDELVSIKGIKKAKAMEILAILEISKRLTEIDCISENKTLNPLLIIDHLRFKIGFNDKEEFYVVYVNNAGKIIKSEVMYRGTMDSSLVAINEVLRNALMVKTKNLIIAHNHPSDNCKPSNKDIELTKAMVMGCRQVGLNLLDHLIISKTNYFSFKKEGLLLQ